MHPSVICLFAALLSTPTIPPAGSISGIVVNGTHDNQPVPDTPVALRVRVDEQWVLAGETKTDENGRYLFDNIPADADYQYLPGANWNSVHYPAEKVKLDHRHADVNVPIVVFDAIPDPNPLVIHSHEIEIQPEADALRVTESIVVDNPSQTTYVGKPNKIDGRAATLTLSIPSDFVRTTFQKEFYGRRFALIDDKLVTDVPWTPGSRNLKFTYVLPRNSDRFAWSRPVDLPSSKVSITVLTQKPQTVTCNLDQADIGKPGVIAYSAAQLPLGHVIEVDFGNQPHAAIAYARWTALLLLIAAVGATALFTRIRGRQATATPRRAAKLVRS